MHVASLVWWQVCATNGILAQEGNGVDNTAVGAVQLTALIEMGVTQDPIVTMVYEEMPPEKQKLIAAVAPMYPSLLSSCDDELNYAAFIENLESNIKFKTPSVYMQAEHFPYVAKCPSIQ